MAMNRFVQQTSAGNDFLGRLRAGRPTLMLGVRGARTADIVRVAQSTGHHAILVDLEHSTMSQDVAASLCAAAADLGLMPFVRTPERDYGSIGRLLDGGALGIVAPRIETPEEAMTIVRACRFPPRGQRSQLGSVPALGMRPTPSAVLNPTLDAATVVQILVETPLGIDNAEAIAAIDGVDMLSLGANDLTAELGIAGQYDHPLVREAVATVAKACANHGKLFMLGGISDPDLYSSLAQLGVCPLVVTGMDTDLMYGAVQSRADAILQSLSEVPTA
jgi:2-keto-3-deoxy-L-rhamnonate aldolase RhmA